MRWHEEQRSAPRSLIVPQFEHQAVWHELQRRFTTSEPSQDQLDVAQAALKELVRLEEAAPELRAGA